MRPRHGFARLLVVASVAASIIGPGTAFAQSRVAFDALALQLRPGDTVTITGRTLGELKGKVIRLVPDGLDVQTSTGVRSVSLGEIDRVRRKRMGICLGAIVGAAVGATSGALLYAEAVNEGGDASGAVALAAMAFGIGVATDAAINLPRTVYRRARP